MSILALLLVITLGGCNAISKPKPLHVLFVGNSLTYVGNLPAVLAALASANGHVLQTAMIVKGGATLTERLDDNSVQRALDAGHYDFVVLQERGGDFLCDFGPRSCQNARSSLNALVRVAHAHHVQPLLLGTYQTLPEVSNALVQTESSAATRASVPYVSVSDRLQKGLKNYPRAQWFYSDGMHPGHDLALLESVLLYQQFYGKPPAARAFVVNAPMYEPRTKFSAPTPLTTALPMSGEQQDHAYSPQSVAEALILAR